VAESGGVTGADPFHVMALVAPRQRNPPKCFTGAAIEHVAATVNEYYRPKFFVLINTAVQQLRERLGDSVGLIK